MIRRSGALGAVALLLCVACSNDAKTPSASKTPRASITTTTTTTTATTATATGPAKPSAGCGTATGPAPPVTKEKRTLPVDGTDREFLLTVPARPAAAKPMPLVIDFHGLAEGDQIHSQMTEFGTLGLKDGFVVLTPQGLGALAHWEIDPKLTPNPDLDFVTQMIDRTERDFCIDSSRVYATGLSYGAFMSSSLACRMADRFAAVAPVSGLQLPDPCQPTRRMPILTFHGTGDPILKFNGGIGGDALAHALSGAPPSPTTTVPADLNGPGFPATVLAWAEKDGCQKTPTDSNVSEHVIHRVYRCPTGVAVEFYIVLGGGHSWPGSEFSKAIESLVGPTTFEINATEAIWKFFQRYQLT